MISHIALTDRVAYESVLNGYLDAGWHIVSEGRDGEKHTAEVEKEISNENRNSEN